jgi:hypothetical protein
MNNTVANVEITGTSVLIMTGIVLITCGVITAPDVLTAYYLPGETMNIQARHLMIFAAVVLVAYWLYTKYKAGTLTMPSLP